MAMAVAPSCMGTAPLSVALGLQLWQRMSGELQRKTPPPLGSASISHIAVTGEGTPT
jgi:hypothetical protein